MTDEMFNRLFTAFLKKRMEFSSFAIVSFKVETCPIHQAQNTNIYILGLSSRERRLRQLIHWVGFSSYSQFFLSNFPRRNRRFERSAHGELVRDGPTRELFPFSRLFSSGLRRKAELSFSVNELHLKQLCDP